MPYVLLGVKKTAINLSDSILVFIDGKNMRFYEKIVYIMKKTKCGALQRNVCGATLNELIRKDHPRGDT